MAKRPPARPKASDTEAPPRPKKRRPRAGAAPASATAPPAEPSADDIRRRAYERYLERGGGHGRHFDDWLEAERELRSKK